MRGRKIRKALFMQTFQIQECNSITGMKKFYTYLKSSGIRRVYGNPTYSHVYS
jgi:hypothetical protein